MPKMRTARQLFRWLSNKTFYVICPNIRVNSKIMSGVMQILAKNYVKKFYNIGPRCQSNKTFLFTTDPAAK